MFFTFFGVTKIPVPMTQQIMKPIELQRPKTLFRVLGWLKDTFNSSLDIFEIPFLFFFKIFFFMLKCTLSANLGSTRFLVKCTLNVETHFELCPLLGLSRNKGYSIWRTIQLCLLMLFSTCYKAKDKSYFLLLGQLLIRRKFCLGLHIISLVLDYKDNF